VKRGRRVEQQRMSNAKPVLEQEASATTVKVATGFYGPHGVSLDAEHAGNLFEQLLSNTILTTAESHAKALSSCSPFMNQLTKARDV
jgi:chemotaxis protein CheY-P-specific phosphatase CheC